MDTLPPSPRRLGMAGFAAAALITLPALLQAQASPVPGTALDGASLRPGHVLVIASWSCAFMQLDRVNELGMRIVEEPLSQLVEQGRLVGWGQFNGEFRDEYNYHTYYLAESQEQYRAALSRVLNHISGPAQDDMAEFYQHCARTRELTVRVVTARP